MASRQKGKTAQKPKAAQSAVAHLPAVMELPAHGPSTNAEMYLAAMLATMGAMLAELHEIAGRLAASGADDHR